MDVTDVRYVVRPNTVDILGASGRKTTPHNIDPHNSDARISDMFLLIGHQTWSFSHACAALNRESASVALLRDRYRGRGRGAGKGSNGMDPRAEHLASRTRAKEQANITDSRDDYSDVVLGLWTQNARMASSRDKDKVQRWLDSPTESSLDGIFSAVENTTLLCCIFTQMFRPF